MDLLVGRGRFGPSFCLFHLLALAFLPPGWGLASDSGTIACLESFGDIPFSSTRVDISLIMRAMLRPAPHGVCPLGGTRHVTVACEGGARARARVRW